MNSLIKRMVSVIIVATMLLTLGACKSKKKALADSSSISEYVSDSAGVTNASSENQSTVSSSVSSGSTNVSSGSPVKTESTLGSVPASLKGTTLTVYSWNAVNDVPGAANIIKKFQNETKIKVSWKVGSYNNYKGEIAAMVAAQNSPDVIRLRGVEPGILSLMSPVTVSGYDFKESIWDSFVSSTYTFNSKTYAVNRANTLLQQPLVMFYNKSLTTKYDLSDPYSVWKKNKNDWNWDTFSEICSSYKNAAGADSIPWMINGYKDYALTFGAELLQRNGDTFTSNVGNEKLLTGFQAMANFGSSKMAVLSGWDMNGFNTGKYLFFGPAIISARRTHFDLTDLKKKGMLGVVPYPCVKGQETYYQSIWEVEAYGIPKGAKNATAVPYFLKYYLDGDKYDANSFFNDKTILDVYKYCMTNTTLLPEYDRYILQLDLGGADYSEFNNKLVSATSAQIPTILNTYAPVIEKAARDATNALAALN